MLLLSCTAPVKDLTDFPVIVQELSCEKATTKDALHLDETSHQPLFFGTYKDTLYISGNPEAPYYTLSILDSANIDPELGIIFSESTYAPGKYGDYFSQSGVIPPQCDPLPCPEKLPSWDSLELKIIIDTTQQLCNWDRILTHPVLIKNISGITAQIGCSSQMYMTIEALTPDSTWKTVKDRIRHFCGNGIIDSFLPPNEIALTNQVITSGEVKTKLRIKLGMNYSNEWDGYISKNQEFLDY